MSWYKLVYYPEPIKIHYVTELTKDYVISYNQNQYGCKPTKIEAIEEIKIDPGGMICVDATPLTGSFEDYKFACNSEHILSSLMLWSNIKVISGILNEEIYKVFLSEYSVFVMEKTIHEIIGLWLANNKTEGYLKSMELYEAFSGQENISIKFPESNIES